MESAALFMKNIKKWGADEVFLEVGYGNKVLNHSKIFPVMDAENDWMKILCTEAKKQGLKVHAWIKVCFWVHQVQNLEHFPILKQHPEWIDLNRKAEMVSTEGTYEEKHFIFVNPAHPGVVKAECDFVQELCSYDIDGISIDYIRFKATRPDPETWFGYNKYSVEQFKKKTGLDPLAITVDRTSGSDFMKWVEYNEGVIEQCVADIAQCVREINKKENRNIILSASPFTRYVSGESPKFQNWKPWDDKQLIDLWLPMCMSIDMDKLEAEIKGVKALNLNAPYYPVVYPNQHGSLHPPMRPHHDVLVKTGIKKFAVFSYKQLKTDMDKIDEDKE
jgi:uncharacterized lipoprotein YddW (UPF0748 family)